MKKIAAYTLYLLGLFTFIVLIFAFRPIYNVSSDECVIEQHEITYVFEGGVKDAVFRIKDNNKTLYINRGLENGLNLERLRKDAVGKQATFYVVNHWRPFGLNEQNRHVSRLEIDGAILYDELIDK